MFAVGQHGMSDYEKRLRRRCDGAWAAPKFKNHYIFWIALNQNIGHIFSTRFCLAANDK